MDIYGLDILEIYCEGGKIDKLEFEMRSIIVFCYRDCVFCCLIVKFLVFEIYKKYVENFNNNEVIK